MLSIIALLTLLLSLAFSLSPTITFSNSKMKCEHSIYNKEQTNLMQENNSIVYRCQLIFNIYATSQDTRLHLDKKQQKPKKNLNISSDNRAVEIIELVHQNGTTFHILCYSDRLHNTTSAGSSIFVANHYTTAAGSSIM